MLDETKPDMVLVTTIDGFHHKYIIRALDKGYNVLSEKPLTTTEENCLAIRDAEKRSGKKVTVTFNCRFMPYFARIKEVLMSGVIGKPLSIHYEYLLNTVHGGDYFKRWHRFMQNSGGMLVHKSTHHFDIINWLLQDDPVSVSAQGARLYFGNDDRPHGERCTDCQYAKTCESYFNFKDYENITEMYFNSEKEDGYLRDHCAFKADTDIYDSMSVSVAYTKGTLLTYSLNLFSTNEGYNLNIIGEKGRIEASTFFGGDKHKLIVRYRNGRVDEMTFPKTGGGHDGGDDRMLDMFFGGLTDDPLGQCSDSYDGIKSALIGISANRSIKEGRRIDLTDTLKKLK
jgi:predicted dehydrogenase